MSNNYKEIFENIPEGIVVCDEDFKITELNSTFLKLSGYNKEDLINLKISEIIKLSKSNCPICSDNDKEEFTSDNFTHLAEVTGKDNNIVQVRITHKITDSNSSIAVITPLSEIAFLSQAHMDFVSTVSHELRTPLTSIKGFADTLLTAGDKLDKDQQQRFISIIKTQIDRLTRLVENLLTVSRLEARKDRSIYKEIDFKSFITPILQGIQPKAEKHKIHVTIAHNLPPIWADADKFEQIMTNLIDNAIKYSTPGTTIIISAGYSNNNPDFVDVKVKDQGIGIPKEFIDTIFTKFSRIDNPLTRQVQGTGLGLYITKSLVENMNGKISVNSNEEGTEFTVTMPIATPEKHAGQKFHEEKV